MNKIEKGKLIAAFSVTLTACSFMNGGRTLLSKKVSVEKNGPIINLCLYAYVPCLIEGNVPLAPKKFVSQPASSVLNEWLKDSDYEWAINNGVIQIYRRSESPQKVWLNKRIDIEFDNYPADKAILEIFHKAGVSAGLRGNFFNNKVYPSITLHAKGISVHEAVNRILKQNPPLGLEIAGPPEVNPNSSNQVFAKLLSNSATLTVTKFFETPN